MYETKKTILVTTLLMLLSGLIFTMTDWPYKGLHSDMSGLECPEGFFGSDTIGKLIRYVVREDLSCGTAIRDRHCNYKRHILEV